MCTCKKGNGCEKWGWGRESQKHREKSKKWCWVGEKLRFISLSFVPLKVRGFCVSLGIITCSVYVYMYMHMCTCVFNLERMILHLYLRNCTLRCARLFPNNFYLHSGAVEWRRKENSLTVGGRHVSTVSCVQLMSVLGAKVGPSLQWQTWQWASGHAPPRHCVQWSGVISALSWADTVLAGWQNVSTVL